jgi:hypothetical protein
VTPAERKRLVGILGRLGSDHDGERAAAGLLASRMLRSAGLSWEDVIPGETSRRHDIAPRWRADLGICQRNASYLRRWEQDFVANISVRLTITPKQRATLAEIADALRDRGRA